MKILKFVVVLVVTCTAFVAHAGSQPVLARKGMVISASVIASDKRMLSSMSPTILARDGKVFMVTGSPGGRTIINTTLLTILDVVDFGMNAQEAVDAGRIHHQWLPDRLIYERHGFSPDTLALLRSKGHDLKETSRQGAAEVIVYDAAEDLLEGGVDRRQDDSGAAVH